MFQSCCDFGDDTRRLAEFEDAADERVRIQNDPDDGIGAERRIGRAIYQPPGFHLDHFGACLAQLFSLFAVHQILGAVHGGGASFQAVGAEEVHIFLCALHPDGLTVGSQL